jgi:hypothetical protein
MGEMGKVAGARPDLGRHPGQRIRERLGEAWVRLGSQDEQVRNVRCGDGGDRAGQHLVGLFRRLPEKLVPVAHHQVLPWPAVLGDQDTRRWWQQVCAEALLHHRPDAGEPVAADLLRRRP